jgi:hypothetical protein
MGRGKIVRRPELGWMFDHTDSELQSDPGSDAAAEISHDAAVPAVAAFGKLLDQLGDDTELNILIWPRQL